MTRLDLLELDEIPETYRYPFTDDYLGDRHIFWVWQTPNSSRGSTDARTAQRIRRWHSARPGTQLSN